MAIKDDMEDIQEAVINELITENGITNTLADGQVIEAKIADNAVTTAKIADGSVTTAKLGGDVDLDLADNEVTTAKINNGAVTPAKLDRAYLETTGGTITGDIANTSGDFTLDVAGDIILDADGGTIKFKDGGAHIANIGNSSSDLVIENKVQDKDIKFMGDDGGAGVTALTLDMSAAGAATFNSFIYLDYIRGKSDTNTGINIADSDVLAFQTGGSERMRIQADGTIKISNSSEPSTPSGGGVLYVQNGALKFKGSSGTVTTIANA